MQIIKVFTKSYDAPSGIICSRFITKNGRKITLQLSDSHLFRIVILFKYMKVWQRCKINSTFKQPEVLDQNYQIIILYNVRNWPTPKTNGILILRSTWNVGNTSKTKITINGLPKILWNGKTHWKW